MPQKIEMCHITGDELNLMIQESFAEAQEALLQDTRKLLSDLEEKTFMLKKWLTLDECVLYFKSQIKRETIRRNYLKDGLKHSKVGQVIMIHVDDLEAYIESKRT